MRSMTSRKENGFTVYSWRGWLDLWPIVDACMKVDLDPKRFSGVGPDSESLLMNVEGREFRVKLMRSYAKKKRWAYKVETENETYILKRHFTLSPCPHFLFSRILGMTFYTSLMAKTGKATSRGCTSVQDCLLVAEKAHLKFSLEAWVLLEYLPGSVLRNKESAAKHVPLIVACFEDMLHHGITTWDINPGNIIIDGERIKLIDITNSLLFPISWGQMISRFKYHYDIDIPVHGVVNKLLKWFFDTFYYGLRRKKL